MKKKWITPATWLMYGLLVVMLMAAVWQAQRTYVLALLGDPKEQYEYGRQLDREGKFQDGLVWIERAATADYVPACMWMGFNYLFPDSDNFGLWNINHKWALDYFQCAAERGESRALFPMAVIYENSRQPGVKDLKKALNLYVKAGAQADIVPAMERLIQVYEKGELGEKPSKELADWMREELERVKSGKQKFGK